MTLLFALFSTIAHGQSCATQDLPTSMSQTTETLLVKVLGETLTGTDRQYKVRIKNLAEGCVDAGQTAYLVSSIDPNLCGDTLPVGETWVVTATYQEHVGGAPVFRFDQTGFKVKKSALTQADLSILAGHTPTCRRDWWIPAVGTTWQWQLQGNIDTTVQVSAYDIDLFDAPQATIDQLHIDGRTVICYFSAGSWENWRTDAGDFAAADKGLAMGWPGEQWLDVRSQNVRSVMRARLDLAVSKGCDAVEPDNVDGYQNNTGFPLSRADQLEYNRFLAHEAHQRGLSVGLKNALGLIPALQEEFDWALNEECVSFQECPLLDPFVQHGKAVFHTEYVNQPGQGAGALAQVCPLPERADLSTLIKTWDLTAWGLACP